MRASIRWWMSGLGLLVWLIGGGQPILEGWQTSPPPALVNPGFEQDWTGWARGGWHLNDDEVRTTIEQQDCRESAACLRIDHPQPNDTYLFQSVSVAPRTLYRIAGWIKTNAITHHQGGIGATLSIPNTRIHSVDVESTEPWVSRELWVRTGARQRRLALACRLGYWSSVVTGTAWFDDITLEEVRVPPAGVVVHDLPPVRTQTTSYWVLVGIVLGAIIAILAWLQECETR